MKENPSVIQLAEMNALKALKCEFESHQRDHPIYKFPTWKIYGPYQRKLDLRRHVIAYNGIEKITISYPKFIMECVLGRLLSDNEEVHHKNELEFDDRLDNYEIINSTEHRKNHRTNIAEYFTCPVCDKVFFLEGSRLSNFKSNKRKRPNMKGPYCSKSCSGKENN